MNYIFLILGLLGMFVLGFVLCAVLSAGAKQDEIMEKLHQSMLDENDQVPI